MQVSTAYMNGCVPEVQLSYFKGCFSGIGAEYSCVKKEKQTNKNTIEESKFFLKILLNLWASLVIPKSLAFFLTLNGLLTVSFSHLFDDCFLPDIGELLLMHMSSLSKKTTHFSRVGTGF